MLWKQAVSLSFALCIKGGDDLAIDDILNWLKAWSLTIRCYKNN